MLCLLFYADGQDLNKNCHAHLQVIMSLLAGPGQDVTREAASSPADLSEQSSASVQHNSRLHILHLQAVVHKNFLP